MNESTVATRLHGRPPISTRKFEHSHAFCFGADLAADVLAAALGPATCSASNSTSKYAASFDEPSSLGTVTLVISAFMKSSRDCAL